MARKREIGTVLPLAGGTGKHARARRHEIRLAQDVQAIRRRMGLSQSAFAGLLGVSTRTLQDWEQGRRIPTGPARALLRVADRHPRALLG